MPQIAVVGVEENLGREVLSLLAERGYKAQDIIALSLRSATGSMVSFGEEDEIDVLRLDNFDFASVKFVIFASTTGLTKKYLSQAAKAKVKIIDASGASTGNPDVPMILSGYNDDKLGQIKSNVVSVPTAEVAQMLIPLQNIHRQYNIKRVVVSTYSSTSAFGRQGMDELFNQTRKIFMNETLADEQNVFHKQIAFNVIPHLGDFIGEETSVEWSFNAETKQIFGSDIKVHANCSVIPAFIGSAQYINIECINDIDVSEAKDYIKKTKGVVVFDKQVDGGYVTLHDVQGEDNIYVSRLRQDSSVDNGISFWCVADNLRSAAATNICQIIKNWK